MKTGTIIALVIAGVCIVAGLSLVLYGAVLAAGTAGGSATDGAQKTVEITEPVAVLVVETSDEAVRVEPSKDGVCRVTYRDMRNRTHTVETGEDVGGVRLTVREVDRRQWYEHIGVFSFGQDRTVIVSVPIEALQSVRVQANSGSIAVSDLTMQKEMTLVLSSGTLRAERISAAEITASASSGSVRLTDCSASSGDVSAQATSGRVMLENVQGAALHVKATSGGIQLSDIAAQQAIASDVSCGSGSVQMTDANFAGDLTVHATSGSIHLTKTVCHGAAQIDVTSGSVRLQGFDAKGIRIKATSGSVTGSLLSGKQFETHTTSGSAHVPDSDPAGDPCRVETTSGSIRLTVEP